MCMEPKDPGFEFSPSMAACRQHVGSLLAALVVSSVSLTAGAQSFQLAGQPESGDNFGTAVANGDFDCDGVDDIAIGVPNEDINGLLGAGAVTIFYTSDQSSHQFTASRFYSNPSEADQLGASLAAGDFDADGCDDLAIGTPNRDTRGTNLSAPLETNAGGFVVAYGTPDGIEPDTSESFTFASLGFALAQEYAMLGYRLAAGDFDGDGADDLVVSALCDVDDVESAGLIGVFYGSETGGLEAAGSQSFHHGTSLAGNPEAGAMFGYSLAVGDFDGNGDDDIAVSAPGAEIGGHAMAGSVNVLYSDDGVTTDDVRFHANSNFIGSVAGGSYLFGYAVAAGDFDGDGVDDLAIGSPQFLSPFQGTVDVIYSAGAAGLVPDATTDLFRPGEDGLPDASEVEYFGYALAAGDFNEDGRHDLAIGAPAHNHSAAIVNSGAVSILYGASGGVTTSGAQRFDQNSKGVLDACETSDYFGEVLTIADLDGDGASDLVTGTPFEDHQQGDSGMVQAFFGKTGTKLDYARDMLFTE